jgi:hypothetical protein
MRSTWPTPRQPEGDRRIPDCDRPTIGRRPAAGRDVSSTAATIQFTSLRYQVASTQRERAGHLDSGARASVTHPLSPRESSLLPPRGKAITNDVGYIARGAWAGGPPGSRVSRPRTANEPVGLRGLCSTFRIGHGPDEGSSTHQMGICAHVLAAVGDRESMHDRICTPNHAEPC